MTSGRKRPPPESRFEALVRPHYEALYRTAWLWTRSTADAEGLVHDAVVRAWPRLGELERLDEPRSALTRIMYRLFIDSARRREGRKNLADVARPEASGDRLRNAERVTQVWRRIDRQTRALLALHDIEGHALGEIAEVTGLREATLKSRLRSSRVLLGRLLDPDCVVTNLEAGAAGTES